MLRAEEIEDLVSLEGSLATLDDGVAEMGAEEQLFRVGAGPIIETCVGTKFSVNIHHKYHHIESLLLLHLLISRMV